MAREHRKLTALAVSRAKQRGYYADGGGLYLQVSPSGAKSWVFRFKKDGRLREMGLGAAHTIFLAEAREHATECRKQRLRDIDPIEARHANKAANKLAAAKSMTFRQCAETYIAAHKSTWVNAKHAAQWPSSLTAYAYPIFGDLPVQSIDVALVTKALEPIWRDKTETASRLGGRIEAVLSWATVRGYRHGDNPARWRGHLDKLLPARANVQRVDAPAPVTLSEVPHRPNAARSHSRHLDLLSGGLNRVHLEQPRDDRAARPNSPGLIIVQLLPKERAARKPPRARPRRQLGGTG
jgi:hypothetical protein